ncbi:dapdiamide synthesis protein DdaC-like [Hydractinia symbiolongicarpus]|uniref:dapdiamide synthesis protein DdaC-like n=1 Tax=Hydractinia symbiolongicarpus TaxID=13093 RepID=UPI00254E6D31|nr:dapdiamide synthesis protein DdaC-like [Hydractinia symbiolongicarpus]
MSYLKHYPKKVMFCCIVPPTSDGETPVCFNRELLAALNPRFLKKFEEKKIRFYRNYADKRDTNIWSWQSVFETDSKKRAEEILDSFNSHWQWHSNGALISWHMGEPFITHPKTNEKVWFNQITLLHNSFYRNHPFYYEKYELKAKNFPSDVTYGDGEEIELEFIDYHRAVQWNLAVGIQWEKGDLLVLDNLLAQHGRMGYQGERKLVVGLIDE